MGLTALVALACAPPAEMATDTAADVAAIEAVRGQEVAAIMSGDTTAAYMTDDVVLMPPMAPQVNGKAAARAWMREFVGMMTVESLTYDNSQITVSGDWAIETYSGSATMGMGGAAATTETMKGVHIYRRGADGTWKMAADIWNMNTPPAAGM